MVRLLLVLLLLAAPAAAQDQDFSLWAKEQIARLEQQVDALKERVDALSEQAKPVVRGMRQKFEDERPALEETGRSFWEKLKALAAAVVEDVREVFSER